MATDSDPFSWITAQADGTEHAVTYTAQEASAALGHGIYEAVCGEQLLSASMDVGPLERCVTCVAILRARAALRDLNQRMTARQPRWLARLCPRGRSGRHRARGTRPFHIKEKPMKTDGRAQSAFIFATASVDSAVDIEVRMNSHDMRVATIGFGTDQELIIDFCDVDSLERLAAVAADGARQLRERIAEGSSGDGRS